MFDQKVCDTWDDHWGKRKDDSSHKLGKLPMIWGPRNIDLLKSVCRISQGGFKGHPSLLDFRPGHL